MPAVLPVDVDLDGVRAQRSRGALPGTRTRVLPLLAAAHRLVGIVPELVHFLDSGLLELMLLRVLNRKVAEEAPPSPKDEEEVDDIRESPRAKVCCRGSRDPAHARNT